MAHRTKSSTQAYDYEPLPTARHVRFLELAIKDDNDDDDQGNTIDIHVHVADLDDSNIKYDAVSYVWESQEMR